MAIVCEIPNIYRKFRQLERENADLRQQVEIWRENSLSALRFFESMERKLVEKIETATLEAYHA
jgi:FtsZ-binding cell division protein ZapB